MLVTWLLIRAWLVRLSVHAARYLAQVETPMPSYPKANITLLAPGLECQLVQAVLLFLVGLRAAGIGNAVLMPLPFFVMAGLLIVLLPTTAVRACLVVGVDSLTTVDAAFGVAAAVTKYDEWFS